MKRPGESTSDDWQPCIKLTTQRLTTYYGEARWGEGIENPNGVRNGRDDLCSSSWYHAYDNPYRARLFNDLHADIENPVFWLAEWRGTRLDEFGEKFGATELRTVRRLESPPPAFTPAQNAIIALVCAEAVTAQRAARRMTGYADAALTREWLDWAARWLSGEGRHDDTQGLEQRIRDSANTAASGNPNISMAFAVKLGRGGGLPGVARLAGSVASAATVAVGREAASDILDTAVAWALALAPEPR